MRQIIEELRAKYPKEVGAPGPEVKLDAKAGTTTADAKDAKPAEKPAETPAGANGSAADKDKKAPTKKG